MEYVFIVLSAFAVVVIPIALFIVFGCKHSTGLTLNEMRDCERKIEKDQRYQMLIKKNNCDDIAKELKLNIVESDDLESGYVSCLCPTEDDNSSYNGIIKCKRINEDIEDTNAKYLKNFRCYHEFIHYLWDVGIDQQVKKCYGKAQKGETKSHREQVINYMAAAIAIPRKALMKELLKYEDEDHEEKVKILSEEFKQPRETISRRIKEIEFLS